MAEAAKVPALGRRCAVGHGGTGGKQKRYLVMARSESLFGWEKVYTESCTQRCKEMKGKKKKNLVWEETVPPKQISRCLRSVQSDPESR